MSTTDRSRSKKRKMEERQGPREDVLPWDDFFMGVACLAAKRSQDPNTQVGACIMNQEKKIVGVGYNMMPNDSNDFPWDRNGGYVSLKTKHFYVCHAELNAIVNTNSADLKGCTIYVTMCPCNECTKLIIQSGISRVVYLSGKHEGRDTTTASKDMLGKASIDVRQIDPEDAKDKKIEIDFGSFL